MHTELEEEVAYAFSLRPWPEKRVYRLFDNEFNATIFKYDQSN